MSGYYGSFAMLYPIVMLLGLLAVAALMVVTAMALLAWRRRLHVATELDRLRIEQHVARGDAIPPLE